MQSGPKGWMCVTNSRRSFMSRRINNLLLVLIKVNVYYS